MLVKTYGSAVFGIDATTITIEVNLGIGINFHLVGLPDSAVKESQQRIKAAFKNNNLKFPGKEITVNMAPADIRKEGSVFDLPIALGILAVSEQVLSDRMNDHIILGELSLDGSLKPLKGILLPKENAVEAAVVDGLSIYGMSSLNEVVQFLNHTIKVQPTIVDIESEFQTKLNEFDVD